MYGFGRNLNLYGSAAFIFDTSVEIVGAKVDGDGLAFGIGVKGEYEKFNVENAVFSWYAQILKANDDFDDGTDGDGLEITAGVILKKEIHKNLIGYAGLEYALNSDWTIGLTEEDYDDDYDDDEASDSFLSETDGERKNKLGIKLGLIIPLETCNIFVDAGLMNELSLKVGFNYPFGGSRSVVSNSAYSNNNSDKIRNSQQKLYELGYNPGPIDGVAGNRYQDALLLFQKESGLLETGNLNEATINALGIN